MALNNRELPQELDVFLKTIANNLSKAIKHNILPTEWFSSNSGNRESVLHARVLAILAKSGCDLKYVVEIEPGFKPACGRQFRPDLQLWRSDHQSFLIEYESTNSSDSRILWKDLPHFEQSRNNEPFPDFWLIIYTLPNEPVTKWKIYDYRTNDPRVVEMKANPHKYYKKIFEDPSGFDNSPPNILEYTVANSDWRHRRIIMVNLTEQGLEIDYPAWLNKHYVFT